MDLPRLRAFCHLLPERSFEYAPDWHSVLCHRCSGIYGGFLLALGLAALLRWNGRWGKAPLPVQMAYAIALIALSLIQVLAEDHLGQSVFTDPRLRFLFGCMAGLALLQLYTVMSPPPPSGRTAGWMIAAFVALFVFHGLVSSESWHYSALTSMLGLAALYIMMNRLVLRSFFSRLNGGWLLGLALAAAALEWTALYFYQGRPPA